MENYTQIKTNTIHVCPHKTTDKFGFRKTHSYCNIIFNCEIRCPIQLGNYEQSCSCFKVMRLFCFNQQKMTEHKFIDRGKRVKGNPNTKWQCVECGCLNG
jgi:hypothetical protein